MIQLPQVTLIAVATANPELALKALQYSCKGIDFGTVKLVSHWRTNAPGVSFEYVDKFASIDDWNNYIFYNLWKHVDTDYALLCHEDGFVVNPHRWRKEFLQYDYCGSTWDIQTAIAIKGNNNYEGELIRVGNSVSLRSKRLLELPSQLGIEWKPFNGTYNEDTMICCHQRKHFVNRGLLFAPVEVSVYFGREHIVPEGKNIEPFVFHKYHSPTHPNWKYKQLI